MSSTKSNSVSSVPQPPKAEQRHGADDSYADAEENYKPKSLKFWLILIGMYMSIFIVALDRLIIATAIPSITDEFHSIQDIGWYGSAYMLTTAIVNPVYGRLYQLYSTKWVYLISIVIFEVGSAVCGAAPNSSAFIVGRAIAGIGAAGIFVGGIQIIIPLVPLRKRPVFTSFFGMAFGVSSVLGPLIGGSFTDNPHLTWRWCFYINLPIGGFTMLAVLLFLHFDSPPREKLSMWELFKRFDPLGLLFFVPSMICLILALQWGGSTYPWSAPRIIGLLVAFGVLLVLFVIVEATMPQNALAPARVILNRSVASALIYIFLVSAGMITVVYYLSIWFQAAQGQSAMEAGIRTIPLLLSMVVFGIMSSIFTQKVGYYVPAMLLSPILTATGAGLLSTLVPSSSSGAWIGYQVLLGLGLGSGFMTSNLPAQVVLPRKDVPIGMAMNQLMQQLGGAVFISVGQNIFSTELVKRLSGIAGLDTETIINTGATALRTTVPRNDLDAVIGAYSFSLTRTFILAAALCAATLPCALALKWVSIKGNKADSPKVSEEGRTEAKIEKMAFETK